MCRKASWKIHALARSTSYEAIKATFTIKLLS